MSESSKSQRADLYKEKAVQLLLGKFISKEINKIEPVYNPKSGFKYPVVESLFEISLTNSSIDEFLNSLSDVGILKREIYDKVIYCPYCNSANISIHYRCPYCKSLLIRKSSLVEHIPCGYIDIEEKFQKEGKLICPKCKKKLSKPDTDYNKAGIWCTCDKCAKSFDIPVPFHSCRSCNQSFTFENCIYKNVYSYGLSEDVLKEVAISQIMITPLKNFLQSRGFTVETPISLKGRSGANHTFDLAAYKHGDSTKIVVIDLATSTNDLVSEQPIIAMFAKIYDVSPKRACFIAIPKMSENGKMLAKLYKIDLIEAKDPYEAIEVLKGLKEKL